MRLKKIKSWMLSFSMIVSTMTPISLQAADRLEHNLMTEAGITWEEAVNVKVKSTKSGSAGINALDSLNNEADFASNASNSWLMNSADYKDGYTYIAVDLGEVKELTKLQWNSSTNISNTSKRASGYEIYTTNSSDDFETVALENWEKQGMVTVEEMTNDKNPPYTPGLNSYKFTIAHFTYDFNTPTKARYVAVKILLNNIEIKDLGASGFYLLGKTAQAGEDDGPIPEDNKFPEQYFNQSGDGYAMITPIYEGLNLTIGQPALIDQEKGKLPDFRVSDITPGTVLSVKVYNPEGEEVSRLTEVDCDMKLAEAQDKEDFPFEQTTPGALRTTGGALTLLADEGVTAISAFDLRLPSVSTLQEGTYRMAFELEGEAGTLYDQYYFTAIPDFEGYQATMNVKHSNNANVANVPPSTQALAYPAVQLTNGKLIYAPDYKGNRIMDYSGTGYKGGTEAIPNVPVRKCLKPLADPSEDAYTMIQEAIDFISGLPLRSDGTRGTLYLEEGVYRISQPLYVKASGVVIRGAGAGTFQAHTQPFDGSNYDYIANEEAEPGVTKLISTWKTSKYDKTDSGTLIIFAGGEGSVDQTTLQVMDQYVGAGQNVLHVSDVSDLQVGDSVLIKKKVNADWAKAMYMDKIDVGTKGSPSNWVQNINQFNFKSERTIVAIDSEEGTITLDTGLADNLDRRWGISTVQKFDGSARITNVGIENVQGISHFEDQTLTALSRYGVDYQYYGDEKHPAVFVSMKNVRDGWFRNFTTYHFDTAYQTDTGTRNVTVQDGNVLDPVSNMNSGERRYSIYFRNAEYMFAQRIFARYMRHAFIFDSYESGPNVFYDCKSEYTSNASEPHFRWSSGGLYDNVIARIYIQNRWNMGTSHGWAGVNYLMYNCEGPFMISQPQLTPNYLIGHHYDEEDKLGSVVDQTTGAASPDRHIGRVLFDRTLPSENMTQEGLNGGLVPNFAAYEYSADQKVNAAGTVSLPDSIYIQQLKEAHGEHAVLIKEQDQVPENIDASGNPLEGMPVLTSLKVDGTNLAAFEMDKFSYEYDVPYGSLRMPVITAEAQEGNTVQIIEPEDLYASPIQIKVTNGQDVLVYTVQLNIYSGLPVVSVSSEQVDASNTNYGVNVLAEQAYSSDAKKWASSGDQWLRLYLGKEAQPLMGVEIGFFKQASNYRQYYFEIESSQDGQQWTQVTQGDWQTDERNYIQSAVLAPGSSEDESEVKQQFLFKQPIQARFIRIKGHGNKQGSQRDQLTTDNPWNTYWRLRPIHQGGEDYTLPEKVEMVQDVKQLAVGETIQVAAKVLPETAQIKDVEWKTSDKSVAIVDAEGRITGVGKGEATITAVAFAGALSKEEPGKLERPEVTMTLRVNAAPSNNNGGSSESSKPSENDSSTSHLPLKPEQGSASGKIEAVAPVDNQGKATIKVLPERVQQAIGQSEEKELIISVTTEAAASKMQVTLTDFSTYQLEDIEKVMVYSPVGNVYIEPSKADLIATTSAQDLVITFNRQSETQVEVEVGLGNEKLNNCCNTVIQAEVGYSLPEGQNPDEVVVCTMTADQEKEVVRSMYDPKTETVRWMVQEGVSFVIETRPNVFQDTPMHWANEPISYLAAQGIVSGRSKEQFAPNEQMTRAELVALLERLDSQESHKMEQASFEDVRPDAWYASSVSWAQGKGIVHGANGKFLPNESISRQDLAVILVNFIQYKGNTLEKTSPSMTFKDEAQIAGYAKESVQQMQEAGMISGKGNQLFDPQGKATRGEVAALVTALMKKEFDKFL